MKKILYILSAALLLVGCKNNTNPEEQTGVVFTLKLDRAFSSDTKAPVNDDFQMEAKHFAGKIMQADKVLYQWEDLSKAPAVIKLDPADNYVFEVYTTGTRNAINEVPMYRGSKQFAVQEYQLTSLILEASIDCMAASVELQGELTNLTNYTMSFYDLKNPAKTLYTLTQAQNTPVRSVYFGSPFAFGVKIEGRMNNRKWSKNIVQFDNIENKVLHTLIVK